jgi:hypothetical protein
MSSTIPRRTVLGTGVGLAAAAVMVRKGWAKPRPAPRLYPSETLYPSTTLYPRG